VAGFVLQGLGVPLPTAGLFGLAAGLIANGRLSYSLAVLLAFGGATAGNLAGYLAGVKWGGRFVSFSARVLRIDEERLHDFERWYAKRGLPAIAVLRWIGWGYAQALWLSGAFRLHAGAFTAIVAASNLFWASTLTLAGTEAIAYLGRLSFAAIALLAVVGLIGAFLIRWRATRGAR